MTVASFFQFYYMCIWNVDLTRYWREIHRTLSHEMSANWSLKSADVLHRSITCIRLHYEESEFRRPIRHFALLPDDRLYFRLQWPCYAKWSSQMTAARDPTWIHLPGRPRAKWTDELRRNNTTPFRELCR